MSLSTPTDLLVTIPHHPRVIKATEARLKRIYDAAKYGLKGDSLALASGMTPQEYNTLAEFDPNVKLNALKGKADAELEHATLLAEASRQGDAKSTLAILQHVHGWTARQDINIDVTARISIVQALEEAKVRVIEGHSMRVVNDEDAAQDH